MTSTLRALLWKEWHEQRDRLLLGCIVIAIYSVGAYFAFDRHPEDVFGFALILGGFLIPIYVAMGVFAPERQQRTLIVLSAMPIPSTAVVLAKLTVGVAVAVIPSLLYGLAIWLSAMAQARDVEAGNKLATSIALAVAIFFWVACAGARQRTPMRAALAGATVMIAITGLGSLLAQWVALWFCADTVPITHWLYAWHPMVMLTAPKFMPSGPFYTSQAAVFALLIASIIPRWRKLDAERSVGLSGRFRLPAWPLFPRSFKRKISVLIWRETAQHRGALMATLALLTGIVLLHFGTERISGYSSDWHWSETARALYRFSLLIMNPLVILIAVSATCGDLNRRQHEFWRSRPIRTGQWFVARLLGGLCASMFFVIAVDLVITIGNFLTSVAFPINIPHLFLAYGPPLVLIYMVAFFAGCYVRNTVPAAFLALAGLTVIWMLPMYDRSFEWLSSDQWKGQSFLTQAYLQYAAAYLFAAGVAAALAWQVIRRDWSWEDVVADRAGA